MQKLSGGRIPADALPSKRLEVDDRPSPAAVRNGSGRSLGAGLRRDGTRGEGLRE
jgi:hypothetical protein